MPAKKTNSTKASSKKTAGKKTAGKKTAGKHSQHDEQYTDPALRQHIKDEVMAGDKGGRPGQWSARKAQLVAHEYVAEGGGYAKPRDEEQQHLKDWGDEHWHTEDGKPAIHGDTTSRYLPDEAWKKLSPAEKKATEAKKEKGSKQGHQYVSNTEPANKARKAASRHTPAGTAPAKESSVESTSKKAVAKKTPAGKSPAKKTPAKRTPAKNSPAKKASATKRAGTKAAAKKAAKAVPKKRAGRA